MPESRGVRPRKLWHWAAIALAVGAFIHEPILTMRFAGDVFRGGGQFIGTALNDAYANTDDPSTANIEQGIQQDPNPGSPLEQDNEQDNEEEGGAVGASYQVDGDTIRAGLDAGTGLVLALHDEVEGVQDDGGLTVTVGTPNGDVFVQGDDGSHYYGPPPTVPSSPGVGQ